MFLLYAIHFPWAAMQYILPVPLPSPHPCVKHQHSTLAHTYAIIHVVQTIALSNDAYTHFLSCILNVSARAFQLTAHLSLPQDMTTCTNI